jgi:hypothetical protein
MIDANGLQLIPEILRQTLWDASITERWKDAKQKALQLYLSYIYMVKSFLMSDCHLTTLNIAISSRLTTSSFSSSYYNTCSFFVPSSRIRIPSIVLIADAIHSSLRRDICRPRYLSNPSHRLPLLVDPIFACYTEPTGMPNDAFGL